MRLAGIVRLPVIRRSGFMWAIIVQSGYKQHLRSQDRRGHRRRTARASARPCPISLPRPPHAAPRRRR